MDIEFSFAGFWGSFVGAVVGFPLFIWLFFRKDIKALLRAGKNEP